MWSGRTESRINRHLKGKKKKRHLEKLPTFFYLEKPKENEDAKSELSTLSTFDKSSCQIDKESELRNILFVKAMKEKKQQ